jgi:peptidoglycan biosynthesis protein MviN/MurJ (putative lipid II flippase)
MIVALTLIAPLGLFSLMIADSIKHIAHAGVSGYLLRRRVGSFSGQRLWGATARAVLASLVMGLAAWAALGASGGLSTGDGLVSEILAVGAPAALGFITYAGLMLALGGRGLIGERR